MYVYVYLMLYVYEYDMAFGLTCWKTHKYTIWIMMWKTCLVAFTFNNVNSTCVYLYIYIYTYIYIYKHIYINIRIEGALYTVVYMCIWLYMSMYIIQTSLNLEQFNCKHGTPSRGHNQYWLSKKWWFPFRHRGTPKSSSICSWDFFHDQPSIFATPMTMDTPK